MHLRALEQLIRRTALPPLVTSCSTALHCIGFPFLNEDATETVARLPEDNQFWEPLVLRTDVKGKLQDSPFAGHLVLLAPLQ